MQSDECRVQNKESAFTLRAALCTLYCSPCFALIFLTALAGFIRFYHLSHPCLWYDESMVFWRICGTYGQLLNCLRTDGFVPLHYSLIWVISRFFRPTPFVLRFVPALCGTLMVPAVYFLARQMLRPATALLAAAFATCSGFLLFYSHDAKMYMDAWLFVTLNMGCLLWWFRTGKSTAWLCWIASGCAACGIHFSSAVPIAISLLLLFTQSRMRWQQSLLWLTGVIVIFSGPVGYYEKFNRWIDRVDKDGWGDSGLAWVSYYNSGRTNPQQVQFLASTLLTGWEWPRDQDIPDIQHARVVWPMRGFNLLLILLAAGMLPWSFRRRIDGPLPQWQIALWLLFWVVIPVYLFYCRSIPDFERPSDLSQMFSHKSIRFWWVILAAVVAAFIGLTVRYPAMRPLMIRGLKLLLTAAAVLALCQVIAMVAAHLSAAASEAGDPWQSLWVPRYIGFVWPGTALAVASLIMRLPTKYLRGAAIVFLLAFNLYMGAFRILGATEPPVDLMATDVVNAEKTSNHTLAWIHLKPGPISPGGGNLFSGPGEYYLDLIGNVATTPAQFRRSLRERQVANAGLPATPWKRNLPVDLTRVIIWDKFNPDVNADQNILPSPAEWKLQNKGFYSVTDFWIRKDKAIFRRLEYVRSR